MTLNFSVSLLTHIVTLKTMFSLLIHGLLLYLRRDVLKGSVLP